MPGLAQGQAARALLMDKLRPIQIAEKYAEETGLDTVELNFSRGKDSLAAWSLSRRVWTETAWKWYHRCGGTSMPGSARGTRTARRGGGLLGAVRRLFGRG